MSLTLNNVEIQSRASDNFINATQLCKAGGKLFADWRRLDSTKELIKALEKKMSDMGTPISPLIDSKKGKSKHFSQGSYVHPKLAIQLAQWISADFALQVSDFIIELFSTGSVSLNNNGIIEENNQLRMELSRLHVLHNELLTLKKLESKDETIYICSTLNYAKQGIFKVGRTKNAMKFRSSTHNITHVAGDKMKVLKEYKVHDSLLVENRIHKKLKGLLLAGEKEFVMCPYDLLDDVVDLIVNNDDLENEMVNNIVDDVINRRMKTFNADQWVHGIDMNVFKETLTITMGDQKEELDVTRWDEDKKRNFVAFCIKEYIKEDNRLNESQFNSVEIIWKTFQTFLMNSLSIRRSDFKVLEWRQLVKQEAEKENMVLKIKN